MYALCVGGQKAAKERLRKAGWRSGSIGIANAFFETMSKGDAMIAFEPEKGDDGYASLPGAFGFGFQPLGRGTPLYEEAMDCLSNVCRQGPTQ